MKAPRRNSFRLVHPRAVQLMIALDRQDQMGFARRHSGQGSRVDQMGGATALRPGSLWRFRPKLRLQGLLLLTIRFPSIRGLLFRV